MSCDGFEIGHYCVALYSIEIARNLSIEAGSIGKIKEINQDKKEHEIVIFWEELGKATTLTDKDFYKLKKTKTSDVDVLRRIRSVEALRKKLSENSNIDDLNKEEVTGTS